MGFQTTPQSWGWDEQILAGQLGIRVPRHVTLDAASHTAAADGSLSFGAGHFVTSDGRLLPASPLVSQASAVLTVAHPGVFVVGDAVTRLDTDAALGNVTAVDVDAGTITLDATPAAIPAGTGIGKRTNAIGILLAGIDLANEPGQVGVCTSASILKDRIPYWDATLDAQFPEIQFI